MKQSSTQQKPDKLLYRRRDQNGDIKIYHFSSFGWAHHRLKHGFNNRNGIFWRERHAPILQNPILIVMIFGIIIIIAIERVFFVWACIATAINTESYVQNEMLKWPATLNMPLTNTYRHTTVNWIEWTEKKMDI